MVEHHVKYASDWFVTQHRPRVFIYSHISIPFLSNLLPPGACAFLGRVLTRSHPPFPSRPTLSALPGVTHRTELLGPLHTHEK